jgi:translation initiation factor IF-1
LFLISLNSINNLLYYKDTEGEKKRMSDNHIELVGRVIEHAHDNFKILIERTEQVVRARVSGKMRQNKINVEKGDRVRVKVSVYDMTNGFIVARLNTVREHLVHYEPEGRV